MKQSAFIVVIVWLTTWNTGFSKTPLSPASKRVQAAYVAWKKHPVSATQQKNFIASFPRTKTGFIAVFYSDDFTQLYGTSWTYISALQKVGATYPVPVINYCLAIGKTHPMGSDAISFLHEVTMHLALTHPLIFAGEITNLSRKERYELFHFLSDVEGIGHYPDYDSLVQVMNRNGETSYATELRKAKQWRLRQPNE